MTRRFALIPLALVSALVIAACGSSSNSGSSGGSASSYGGATSSAPAAPSKSATSAATSTVSTKKTALGTFLVDAKGRALYLWDADKGSMSTCDGACAQAWPPLTAKAMPKASGAVKPSLLGTTQRSDGSREVTYAGHPLYYFAGDTAPGQTTGEGNNGFGAPWWVVTPGGTALAN